MAGAMGWSPGQVAESSLWQLVAAFEGWQRANGATPDGLTEGQVGKLSAMLEKFS